VEGGRARRARRARNGHTHRLGHGLVRLERADVHGRGRGKDVGRLAHELGSVDLCASGDDLGLSDAALRGRRGQRLLQLAREDDLWSEGLAARGKDVRTLHERLCCESERVSAAGSYSSKLANSHQNALNPHTPSLGGRLDNLLHLDCHTLTVRDDGLQGACADDVAERRLGALDERLAHVGDTVRSLWSCVSAWSACLMRGRLTR